LKNSTKPALRASLASSSLFEISKMRGNTNCCYYCLEVFMASGAVLNLEPRVSEKVEPETPGLDNQLTQTRELIEEAKAELRRTQTQLNQQEDEQESQARRTKVLSIVLAILLIFLAGTGWWAYSALKDQKAALGNIVDVQNLTKTLGDRMNSAETELNNAAARLPALSGRVDQLQATMKTSLQTGLETVRSQAQAAATQVGQRLREDMNKSIELVQSRLAALESNQRESSDHMNQLQQQVNGLKTELAAMRTENSTVSSRINDLDNAQQKTGSDLSGLNQKVATSQNELNTLTTRLDRKRSNFSVATLGTGEIAPGILLVVRHIDLIKQQIDGTLERGANISSLPIQGQGIQKPFLFDMPGESRPGELVFTQVSEGGVSGYLLMPTPM
jgi:chromosome segregation ATPase